MRFLDRSIVKFAILFSLTLFSIQIIFPKNEPMNKVSLRRGATKPVGFPIRGSDLMGSIWKDLRKTFFMKEELLESQTVRKAGKWNFSVGSTQNWYADDFTKNTIERYLVPSTCRGIGKNCYVFVEDSSWTNEFVTQLEVDSIIAYFDAKTPANPAKGVFEMDTTVFGSPPDVDGDPKVIILLLNIKDGYMGSGGYVVGYFHPLDQLPDRPKSNAAEIFFIDTNPLNLREQWGLEMGVSTLAHEMQHMIHYRYDQFEETFVNECFSTLAEVICGFPIYDQSYYVSNTNQELFSWHEKNYNLLPVDYARAARFGLYLYDQFGPEVCKYIIRSQKDGIEGINEGLQNYGTNLRFNDIVVNWFIANIINDRTIDTMYGYRYPHLPKVKSEVIFNPDLFRNRDTVKSYAVKYLSFAGGSYLRFNFSAISGFPIIKAVEISPLSKIIVDVNPDSGFFEPEFDSVYYMIHFVIMDMATNSCLLSYYSSGYGGYENYTLCYAENERYCVNVPSSITKFAVRFTPSLTGELYSVGFKLNWDTGVRGNGSLKITIHSNDDGIPGEQLGDSAIIPFQELVNGDWNEVIMRSRKIRFTQGEDFHVVLEVLGGEGDTLQFLLGDATGSENRTLFFGEGPWYPLSSVNLLVKTTLVYPADTMKNVPLVFNLEQNYPNPFNEFTYIDFGINKPAFVSLKIYDILGRLVTTLVNDYKEFGIHHVKFNAGNLSSGIYFYSINVDGKMKTKKMVLIK